MAKRQHEFCDPIHDFVRVDSDERKVIDSPPLQRLRHIHQLAMTFLVYPGATHRRFEHSLGTMELAGRVYDVITNPSNVKDEVREMFPEDTDRKNLPYWRRVVRLAALCHDIGHLPFSHAAEHDLLPDGWSHEQMSRQLILSDNLSGLFKEIKVDAEDVAKVAVGFGKEKDVPLPWENILADIIVGDAFGVDRMDYLLRDSLHVGVPYGNFGHHRLIDTLRILPSSPPDEDSSREISLGVELGGLQSAEALLMARYFMFSQVYFHRVRMIYDQHLIDFLKDWLEDGQFSTDTSSHLLMTDNEVTAGILSAARNTRNLGHKWAKRLASREHFRVLYSRPPQNTERDPEATVRATGAAVRVKRAAEEQYGPSKIRYAQRNDKGGVVDFPVLMDNDSVASSKAVSEVLGQLPGINKEYVYVDKDILNEAKKWLKENLDQLLEMESEEGKNDETATEGSTDFRDAGQDD